MTDEKRSSNDITEAALEQALERLAAAENRAAPRPGDALVARVLADAAAETARASAALSRPAAMRTGRVRAGARGRAGVRRGLGAWLGGGAGFAAAMAAGLAFGFVTGLANPESELVPGVLAAAGVDEEVIIVSDASASMFGAETPF